MRLLSAAVLALALGASGLAAPVAAAGAAATGVWYVDAAAPVGGIGSQARPFDTLEDVEAVAAPGDTIKVLPSGRPLDGGILLKPGQTLVGVGPDVTELAEADPAPTLTNTGSGNDGDAVRLADGVTVRNLRIRDSQRGGIYGEDVTSVRVIGNDVAGHNTSCVRGFLIPPFNAPTNVPGVGLPISGGLPNGWAGIMVDGDSRVDATVLVADNVVHDADCGDGIDVRTSGTASYRATIAGNDVHGLRQGSKLKSVLAIGVQARDTSTLVATITDNRQSALGNPDDINLGPEGADSEGVFVNGVGPSSITAIVERNVYTNDEGIGGFSANGLEAVTMGDGSRLSVVVRDSSFSGSPGDVIEEGALGTNARLRMRLERVVAERSTGIGNTYLLPFNNGDCVLAGSLGAGNDVGLVVRDSVFRDCASNGLAIGSNVVNGRGPTKRVSVDVDRTTITGNAGSNVGVRNFTRLNELVVRIRRSDLAGSAGLGASLADVGIEDLGRTDDAQIDVGASCIGPVLGMDVVRYDVRARGNWWGRAGGPGPLTTAVLGGRLDASAPLEAPPAWC
ncbi:hypothetical protein F0U44_15405 [Nocardioides humilatus]|uniref:Right handed beta helix domain-containing protein n=1 Tax=Nocardioides humilatus TaxID=2607660 RepID=A0A5B1LAA8_9ACTN|nr:hypothetical protein [Nocardioides humilatus]KAA1417681.1 hypothetical protein F0U44_15405 [Nocardioides humilatus]